MRRTMHYFLYPTKDTTISNHPTLLTKNMGLDEILEIEKVISNTTCAGVRGTVLSRTLVHFDLSEISRSFSAGTIVDPEFYLSLKIAESAEVPVNYNIAAWPLAKRWDMGTGYKYDGATTSDGASWKYADSGSIKWYDPVDSSSFSTDCHGGGLWYVSASLMGSGSGYAEAPFVSPQPFNPFPDCPGVQDTARFTVARSDGMYLAPGQTASLEITLHSGSHLHFESFVSSGGFVITTPATFGVSLYDEGTLVVSASGQGIPLVYPSSSYEILSGSTYPRSIKLVAVNNGATNIEASLTLDGFLSGSGIFGMPNSNALQSVFGDVIVKTAITSSIPSEIKIVLFETSSSTPTVGGTEIYSKHLGGTYVSGSSVLSSSIDGTEHTSLVNNPVSPWNYVEGNVPGQIHIISWQLDGTASFEIGILTDTPTTLYAPTVIASGSYGSMQSFNYQSSDIYMNVTNTVMAWIYGVIPNYGFILVHSNETSSYDFGKLRFFSKESNTIYQPHLDVMWDDTVFHPTGSDGYPLTITDISKPAVVSPTINNEYKRGSFVRINVPSRIRYPIKTFTNRRSDYVNVNMLPESSYYSIKDAESEETIIGFDAYTKLSVDEYGSYFMLDTTGLPQERYYNVEIRSEISGSINTFCSPNAFKISR